MPKEALYTVGWAKRGPTGIIGAAALMTLERMNIHIACMLVHGHLAHSQLQWCTKDFSTCCAMAQAQT